MASTTLGFVIRKERFILLSSLALGLVLCALYYTLFYRQLYTTGMELFVRNINNSPVVSDYQSSTTRLSSESGYSNPLFNLKHLLESQRVAHAIYPKLASRYPEALKTLKVKNIKDWTPIYTTLVAANIEPSTDIISVRVSWPDRSSAEDVLTLITDEFRTLNIDVRRYIELKRQENIGQELDSLTGQIDAVHHNIADFETRNGAVNFEEELSGLTSSHVSLGQQAAVLKSKIASLGNKVNVLRRQLQVKDGDQALTASSIGRDPYLQKLNGELATAQLKHSSLKAKYTDKHPEVIAALNEINSLKTAISTRRQESSGSSEPTTRPIYDEASQDVVSDLARAEAELASTKGEYSALLQGIGAIRAKESRVPLLKKNWQLVQKSEPGLLQAYQNTQEKYLEALINVRDVVDNIVPLGTPSVPSSSRKPLLIKLIGIMGLCGLLGLAVAWIKDGVEDQWVDADEVELLTNRPVLGSIPWLDKVAMRRLKHGDNTLLLPSYHHTALQLASRLIETKYQVLSIRSTGPNGGQGNQMLPPLACALADVGHITAVIRTRPLSAKDMVAPCGKLSNSFYDLVPLVEEVNAAIFRHFGAKHSLEDKRQHTEESIQQFIKPIVQGHDMHDVFTFYFKDQSEAQISHILGSRAYAYIVTAMRKYFEIVLVDTPGHPLSFPDVTNVLHTADATLVLAGFNHNRSSLTQIIQSLEEKYHSPVVGIVTRDAKSDYHPFIEKKLLSKGKPSHDKLLSSAS